MPDDFHSASLRDFPPNQTFLGLWHDKEQQLLEPYHSHHVKDLFEIDSDLTRMGKLASNDGGNQSHVGIYEPLVLEEL